MLMPKKLGSIFPWGLLIQWEYSSYVFHHIVILWRLLPLLKFEPFTLFLSSWRKFDTWIMIFQALKVTKPCKWWGFYVILELEKRRTILIIKSTSYKHPNSMSIQGFSITPDPKGWQMTIVTCSWMGFNFSKSNQEPKMHHDIIAHLKNGSSYLTY